MEKMNLFNFEWILTTSPKKGICNIQPDSLNVKLMAVRLQMVGNQNYTASFAYNKINSECILHNIMNLTEYSIAKDKKSCYMKFEGDIGIVEILGEEKN